MASAEDDVQLPDLQVIQRYSLAVRGATARRADVIAALEADLAWLTGGAPRRAAARAPRPMASPGAPAAAAASVAPATPAAAKSPAKKSPAKKSAPAKTATKTPAKKSAARRR